MTNFYSAFGTFNMSGMDLTTTPSSKIMVDLIVSGIDMQVPSNTKYLKKQLGLSTLDTAYTLKMEMIVRGCLLGEGLKESGACYECPAGFYLLQAPITP